MSEGEGATPVSWLLVERGWDVVDRDGQSVGRIDETVGDTGKDIFSGFKVLTGLLGKPKFVPSERVAWIEDGRVQVDLSKDEVDALDEYEEPGTSERFLAP